MIHLTAIASDPPGCPACAYRAGFGDGLENAAAVARALGHGVAERGIRNLMPPTLSEASGMARQDGRPVCDLTEGDLPW